MSLEPGIANRTVQSFLESVAARAPTPGGGAAAASLGALGAALGAMTARYSMGRRRYRDIESRVNEIVTSLDAARAELLELAEADCAAYARVEQAMGLPRATPEQKRARDSALVEANRGALEPPLAIAREARRALEDLLRLSERFNESLAADLAVAAHGLAAAVAGALALVRVNAGTLVDPALAQRTLADIASIQTETLRLRDDVLQRVDRIIGP